MKYEVINVQGVNVTNDFPSMDANTVPKYIYQASGDIGEVYEKPLPV